MPRLWSRSNRVDSEAILPIRIGLTQNNLENAEMHLMDV
jgi:tripeptidyl-peptidase-1